MGNLNTNFRPITSGDAWGIEEVQMTASVAMEAGSGIYAPGDGEDTIVTTSSANFTGILIEPIAATDDDYATAKKKKLCFVRKKKGARAICTVSGTFTTDDVGKNVDFADAVSLDVDTSTHDQATIRKYISATRAECEFNDNIE